jgi:hypothetical protein
MLNLRNRTQNKLILAIICIIGMALLVFISSSLFSSTHKNIVEKFYKFEQRKEFTNSYALFHPLMMEKFSREWYFTQRNHIFFDHFEVDTFQFKIGNSQKLKEWKMSADSEPLSNVYKYPVTLTFNSKKFGYFTLQQDVYVTKEETDGAWKILWSYK